MSQTIGAVSTPHIEHGILIDLVIPTAVTVENAVGSGSLVTITFTDPGFVPFLSGDTITVSGVEPEAYNGTFTVVDCTQTFVTYLSTATGTYTGGGAVKGKDRRWYISNCYTPITYGGKTYQALGGFLEVGNLQQDLITTNNEISVSLSAIPAEYIENIIGQQIKGGAIRLYRVFFDPDTKAVRVISGQTQIFQRFVGVITNWGVTEDISEGAGGHNVEINYSIAIQCSSVVGVLENRVSGRRTNNTNYQTYWSEKNITTAITTDLSFSRIEQLKNASFDFGKPVK